MWNEDLQTLRKDHTRNDIRQKA
eukprot:COSAG02_NODE_62597_length_265_cov_0.933735_1_plen_22_part_01